MIKFICWLVFFVLVVSALSVYIKVLRDRVFMYGCLLGVLTYASILIVAVLTLPRKEEIQDVVQISPIAHGVFVGIVRGEKGKIERCNFAISEHGRLKYYELPAYRVKFVPHTGQTASIARVTWGYDGILGSLLDIHNAYYRLEYPQLGVVEQFPLTVPYE